MFLSVTFNSNFPAVFTGYVRVLHLFCFELFSMVLAWLVRVKVVVLLLHLVVTHLLAHLLQSYYEFRIQLLPHTYCSIHFLDIFYNRIFGEILAYMAHILAIIVF